MNAKPQMDDRSAADVEKQQPLLPKAAAAVAGETPFCAGGGCRCRPCSCTSPTATRTLALVVVATGAAFAAAQLVAREEYVLLAVFASQLASFCVFTSLLALCALPEPEEGGGGGRRLAWWAWARGAAGQVLLCSFAMALLLSMASWVVESAPVAVGAALLGMALAVVFACYGKLAHSLWLRQ